MSLNVWAGSGRLTKDPTLSTTNGGVNLCNFTIAVNRDIKGEDGKFVVDFIDCIAWRQRAEFVTRYFHKGDPCTVTGPINVRDWTDKNGNKRRAVEIIVNGIYFGEGKRKVTETEWAEANEQTEIEDMEEMFEADPDGELPF